MNCSPTSFADVLAVPDLAQACCVALDGRRGSTGLKKLRLLNKEISIAILGQVHSLTLNVGFSDQQQSLQAPSFLRKAKLSRLNVRGLVTGGDEKEPTNDRLEALQQQMDSFTMGMGTALSMVTMLDWAPHLDPNSECFGEQASPEEDGHCSDFPIPFGLLACLAAACPALSNMRLSGPICEEGMQTFGNFCPRLTHLDLELNSLPLEQLPMLFPHVWSLALHKAPLCNKWMHQEQLECAFPSLKAYTSITHLKIDPGGVMVEEMWSQLPPSLRVLLSFQFDRAKPNEDQAPKSAKGPPAGVYLPGLVHFKWDSADLQGIAKVLLAAPDLLIMDSRILMMCDFDKMHCWDLIRTRVQAGLKGLTSFSMWNEGADSHCPNFLAAAQPMPGLRDVMIMAFRGCYTSSGDANLLKHLPRVCPGMKTLVIDTQAITDEALCTLLPCDLLEEVTLELCQHVTAEGVGIFVSRLPSLRLLCLESCDEITAVNDLHKAIQLHSPQVKVTVM